MKLNLDFNVVGLVGIILVIFKLAGLIGWSWWWVTAPFWFGWALLGVVALLVAVIVTINGR